MKKMIREGVKCKKKSEKSLKTPLVPPNANLHGAPLPQIIENSIFLAIKLLNGYLCTRVGSMRVKRQLTAKNKKKGRGGRGFHYVTELL